jgi:type I restriction-modification system DNA methylase subunit
LSREAEFVSQLWEKLDEYLRKYTVNGHTLTAKPPNSVEFKGKVPDIVIVDAKGVPQLIIETKRKIEGGPGEELLNPLGPAPIAQAVCYAVLALEVYGLERTPLFATANRDSLILFKGINKGDLGKIVNAEACLEPKSSPEDWVRALVPGGLEKILNEYIVDRIEHPLRDESLKVLFDYVSKWLVGASIPPAVFYRVFVSQLRSSIESLHEYVKDAVKTKILDDRDYFTKLFKKAKEMGYQYGLLSKGILELRCPSNSRRLCEYLKEKIERELAKASKLTLEEAFKLLSNMSRMNVADLCSEARKIKGVDISSIPMCQEPKKVEDLISFDNLTKMMTYVLANKILAYKILELHYGEHIPPLKPVRFKETVKVNNKEFHISSPNDLIDMLNYVFSYVASKIEKVLGVSDFSPIFNAGLYDEIVLSGAKSIERVSAIIDLVDSWKKELKQLPGIIGYVYEGLLPPRERHQLGQFYTPPAIARLIARWAIRSESDRVLDGGCGSGTFLIEAYKRLLKLRFNKDYDKREYPSCTERYNEHQEILNQLYGVDINAFASHLTSIHLMLMEPRCPISRLKIYAKDYFVLSRNTLASDELAGGFDAVIGNPPYTRWVEIPDETKELIERQLSEELKRYDLKADLKRGREPGIYIYWIMHATKNLLKDKGRIGMIISNMWLQTDYGIDFGRFLLDNFRIVALIDLSFRLFEALISTVIVLAEKEPDKSTRENNIVTLIRIPPRIKGEELDVEKAEKALDDALRCIENSIKSDGSIDTGSLAECRKEYGIWFGQVRQGDIPRDRKWISLFFAGVKDVVKRLEELANEGSLMIKLGEWFEPSRGNSIYSIWALSHGRRPDLGAKEFFYFSEDKINKWENKVKGFKDCVRSYLVPAITRAQYIKTFTFTKDDWELIKNSRTREERYKDAYILVLHEERERLPEPLRKYVEWGESVECRTKISATRGGGRICSEAEACRAREEEASRARREGRQLWFYGWYDLGGFLPTPLMAIYQAFYHPQFFLCKIPVVTYHAIITLIPKVRVETSFMKIDPREMYSQHLSQLKTNIILDETELKALLAYLNSTFVWLWLEQVGRRTGGGIIALEVQHARDMPILNVKALRRNDVEELAKIFDELESEARKYVRRGSVEVEEDEKGGGKMEMFKHLKPVFAKIDSKISEILGIYEDIEWLWSSAWEMMERRIKGSEEPTRPGAEVSVSIDVGGGSKRGKRRSGGSSGAVTPLDKWFKPIGGL